MLMISFVRLSEMNNSYVEDNQEVWGWLHLLVCILGLVLGIYG